MTKKANLLWLDLEMTGLDAGEDKILEVGVVATDWGFNEITTYESAVKVDPSVIKERMVGDFWKKFAKTKKNLIKQNDEAKLSSEEVGKELLKFVEDNFDTEEPIYLAGNSIYKDREFIKSEWPELEEILHYRMLDVSAWKIVFANKYRVEIKKPDKHRAVSDIRGSIDELKEYLGTIDMNKVKEAK
jgi:oligoribonuclease